MANNGELAEPAVEFSLRQGAQAKHFSEFGVMEDIVYNAEDFNFPRFVGSRAISISDIEPKRTSLKMVTTSKGYKVSLRGLSEVRKTSIEESGRDFSTLVGAISQSVRLGVLIFDKAQLPHRRAQELWNRNDDGAGAFRGC